MTRNSYQVCFFRTQYITISVNAYDEKEAYKTADEELKLMDTSDLEFHGWECASVEYEGPEEVEQI